MGVALSKRQSYAGILSDMRVQKYQSGRRICRVAMPFMTRSYCAIWTSSMSGRCKNLDRYRRVDRPSRQDIGLGSQIPT